MDQQAEFHLARLRRQLDTQVDAKYRKGNAEHGGSLDNWDELDLVNAAIDEAIDQFVYLSTLKDRILANGSKPRG